MKLPSAFLLFLAATPVISTPVLPARQAACPTTPTQSVFPSISPLPDPFLTNAGTRVSTKDQWTCRREEINQLFQNFELGTKPPAPSTLTATFSGSTLTITAGDSGKSISFAPTITYPSSGTAPFPAIIAYGGGSLPVPSGVAIINFNNDDIAAQSSSSSRGQGKFYTLYGNTATASATTAWAWGVSRIIDALEKVPAATHRIDVKHLGVTGCSRNGKGAFIAGALDERIALTLPQESGSGGSACWRLSDYEIDNPSLANGEKVQTASEIVQENVWFSQTFGSKFANNVDTLPIDHHELAALVAPRGLLVIENLDYQWLGPWSSFGCVAGGREVYTALGVQANFGFSQVGGHSHCQFPSNQQSDLNAFVGKFLRGDTSQNTNIWRSDLKSPSTFDKSKWLNWSTPTLT